MYKFRIFAQSIVTLFVIVSIAKQLGHVSQVPLLLVATAGGCAAWLALQRTTWLPFLGPTVMPPSVLRTKTPRNADFTIRLQAPPEAVKCVFWGSVMTATDPYQAYGGYPNSGISDVEKDGTTVLALKKPKPYSVYGRTQAPHIHLRWVSAKGMLSGVRTIEV